MAEKEIIGGYEVHPAASLFPLAEEADAEFDSLLCSIQQDGQFLPILVQGNVLLDGRNRLRACIKLDIKPKIQEYTGTLEPTRLIANLNLTRRDLADDVRAIIEAQVFAMLNAEGKAKQRAQGEHGAEGGRGNKKPLPRNHGKGFSQERHERSAAGQIAAAADVTEHKAQQAIDVAKHAPPEVVEKVKRGELKLKDAAKHAREKTKPKRIARPPKKFRDRADAYKMYSKIEDRLEKIMCILDAAERDTHAAVLVRIVEQLIQRYRSADASVKLDGLVSRLLPYTSFDTPQEELGNVSIATYLTNLRRGIDRRRKEADIERQQRSMWNAEGTTKLISLVELIDWIETELDKISTAR